MTDIAALESQLRELLAVRHGGARRIKFRDRETEFQSDTDLAAAISDLERRIAEAKGSSVRTVRFATSKGV